MDNHPDYPNQQISPRSSEARTTTAMDQSSGHGKHQGLESPTHARATGPRNQIMDLRNAKQIINSPLPSSNETNTPCQSPCRRTWDQLDDNDEFTQVTGRNKKPRHDSGATAQRGTTQQDPKYPFPHRYPTRHQQRQQQTSGHHVNQMTQEPSKDRPSPQHAASLINISSAATRFATTRFPFAPFVIRFSINGILEKQVAQELVKHNEIHHQSQIQISNVRISKAKCHRDECDFLIYVKDARTFALLFDTTKWPAHIAGHQYTFPSMPSFPPQLSLVLKNVDLRTDVEDLSACLKASYPEVHNVIRLRNKFQNEIRMIKIEILSIDTRLKLLDDRKLRLNGVTYDIESYLSPATVLICSQCRGIGHFKRQCTQVEVTCNVCGQTCQDMQQHKCSKELKCIHCNGDHMSNSTKCPIIKDYRSALTRKLLATSSAQRSVQQEGFARVFDTDHFPLLPQPQANTTAANTNLMTKIDEILSTMKVINESLDRITSKQNDFEQFMRAKNDQDALMAKKVELLTEKFSETEEMTIDNGNMITKLILPTIELLSKFLYHKNMTANGVDDADFKSQIQTKRTLIEKILSGRKN